MCDVGLLVATVIRVMELEFETQVWFLCERDEQAQFAESLGCRVVQVPSYEEFLKNRRADDYFQEMKFDVIVGNPPFQPDVDKESDSGGDGSGMLLWPAFVTIADELLLRNGDMLFITPPNWRIGGGRAKTKELHNARNIMWSNTIDWYLSAREPYDYFPEVGHSIKIDAWHLLKKEPGCDDNMRFLRLSKLLPTDFRHIAICEKFFKVCHTNDTIPLLTRDKCFIVLKQSKSSDETKHLFPLVNTSAQYRSGKFNWSSTEPSSLRFPKVLLSDSGNPWPFFDEGNVGVGHHSVAFAVKNKQEGDMLVSNLEQLLKLSLLFVNRGCFAFPIHLFLNLPLALLSRPWQEVFDFTDEEVKLIEGFDAL
jgi:hypothetical protein